MKWQKRRVKSKVEILFYLHILFLLILSISFLIMPVSGDMSMEYNTRILLIIVGTMFWVELVGGMAFMTAVNLTRKRETEIKYMQKRMPGMICFFSKKEAIVVDIAMFISIIVFVYLYTVSNTYVTYAALSVMSGLIQTHGILNGNNYRYIKIVAKGEKL